MLRAAPEGMDIKRGGQSQWRCRPENEKEHLFFVTKAVTAGNADMSSVSKGSLVSPWLGVLW